MGSFLAIFTASALICWGILRLGAVHRLMAGSPADTTSVQAAHETPTPRIGGLALLAGFLVTIPLAPAAIRADYALFALSLGPVFLAGFAEDLRIGVTPAGRLAAAMLSSLIAVVLLEAWIPRIGIPGLDLLIAWAPVGIAFTLFAAAGICHAFNLIDGLNGLAAGTGIVTALGLGAVAIRAGDPVIPEISFMLVAALTGFLVFNFPRGRIFLGDAGAYSLGHVLAWLAIVLMVREAAVSPWAMILVFFWPIADTFLAIYRRRQRRQPAGQPDRLHFHQMVMRALEIFWLGRTNRRIANPLATLVLMPFIIAPTVSGVLLWNNALWAFFATLAWGGVFVLLYILGIRFSRVPRARRDLAGAGARRLTPRSVE